MENSMEGPQEIKSRASIWEQSHFRVVERKKLKLGYQKYISKPTFSNHYAQQLGSGNNLNVHQEMSG